MATTTKPLWSREMWGKPFREKYGLDRKNKKGKPLFLENYFTQEGGRMVARCQECSGIHELLIDLRRDGLDNGTKPFTEASEFLRDEWFPKHEGCAENPLPNKIPAEIMNILNGHLADFKKGYANEEGFEIAGHIAALSDKGCLYYMPFNDIPHNDDRQAEAESRKFKIREEVLKNDEKFLYQVSIMEAWGIELESLEERWEIQPRHHPFRTEKIIITVETPDFAKTAEATITRLNRKNANQPVFDNDVFSGPAEVGELKWAQHMEGYLVEGVMAANHRFLQ